MVDTDIQNIWRSERLSFRTVREDDYDWFFTTQQSDPVTAFYSSPGLLSPPARTTPAEFLKKMASPASLLSCVAKNTATSEPETRIGFVSLLYGGYGRDPRNGAAQFGITLNAPYRGNGYGTEATQWVLNWGFRYANLHSVSLGSAEYNKRAHRCYEKCGFKFMGRTRHCQWFDGRYWDLFHFDILYDEWKEGKTYVRFDVHE
ncbi:acyl-CoA N-acyltransferase [Coniella lustricola]|uniref:Acyl-CoA N-acyltransferase n=1 Tax=Coniella lustricola TaxID=2025994 RepID=A0A2T3A753_9PEZI|nr:acyl-CoA N-acyltransferase [Coniella lustricola]